MSLYFRNVDIELLTLTKPAAFLRALRLADAAILFSDEQASGWFISFEVRGTGSNPAQVLAGLKRLFAGLTEGARTEWDEADRRVFDFGYDLEGAERVQETEIPARFLAFTASVDATIRMTVYDENHTDRAPAKR